MLFFSADPSSIGWTLSPSEILFLTINGYQFALFHTGTESQRLAVTIVNSNRTKADLVIRCNNTDKILFFSVSTGLQQGLQHIRGFDPNNDLNGTACKNMVFVVVNVNLYKKGAGLWIKLSAVPRDSPLTLCVRPCGVGNVSSVSISDQACDALIRVNIDPQFVNLGHRYYGLSRSLSSGGVLYKSARVERTWL